MTFQAKAVVRDSYTQQYCRREVFVVVAVVVGGPTIMRLAASGFCFHVR